MSRKGKVVKNGGIEEKMEVKKERFRVREGREEVRKEKEEMCLRGNSVQAAGGNTHTHTHTRHHLCEN